MIPLMKEDAMTDPKGPQTRITPDPKVYRCAAGVEFVREFSAGDTATREALMALTEHLRQVGLGPEDQGNIELILAEALNNVAEHAYAGGSGPVVLRVMTQKAGLCCEISDCGAGMPAGDAPDPPLPVIAPPDGLPEGGFGWHIIRCLTSALTYQREDPWNKLNLTMPWADTEVTRQS